MRTNHERAGWAEAWERTFRSLQNRNYRLFFFGQGISLIGTWMQTVAMSWLVYRLTGSALLLGTVGFASQVPLLLLTPFAGVVSDRWPRRGLLVVTQAWSMLLALALAVLTLTGAVRVWHLIVLAVLLGVVNAFDMPIRQAFTLEMVDRKEDLPNAIALNSSLFNGSRLIGPTLAGALIAGVGEGLCFLLNGLSYLAVLWALLAMRLGPRPSRAPEPNLLRGLRDGFSYAFGSLPIRNILLLLGLLSLVGMPYVVLMPVFAKDILQGGPGTLGLLMASTGVGALVGAILLAARRTIVGLGRLIPFAAGLFGLALIGFAASRSLYLSVPLLIVSGFGMIVNMASSNTILQTIAEEDKRGRLMGLYALSFAGTAPFGSLLAGWLSSRYGAPLVLAWGGVLCIVGAALFLLQLEQLRQQVRPIYRAKGILPEVAQGLAAAEEMTAPPREG